MKRDMTKDQIRQRLQQQTYLETEDGKFAIIDDPMTWLGECYWFMRYVLAGGYELDQLTASNRQREEYFEELRSLLPRMHRYPEIYVPGFVYHPSITLFLEQYRKHPISKLLVGHWPTFAVSDGVTVADVFLDFIRTLKSQANSQGLRKKMADHDAKLRKNQKRLRKFESDLFRRYSRPVIVRLDLEYRATLFANETFQEIAHLEVRERRLHNEIYVEGEALDGRGLPPMRVSLKTVQQDRIKLFANMKGKPSLFRHLVGYVWRFEYGHRAGFHLHLLLAFDGARVRKHEWLAQEIGKYWEVEITERRGRFHNCNDDWDAQAPTYGLGAIEWHDKRLRGNLVNCVLPYLAKFDQYVLARPYRGCKLMGSGFMHRERPTRRGRPRSPMHRPPEPPAP